MARLIPSSLPCALPEAPEGCSRLFDMGDRFLQVILSRLEDFVDHEACAECGPLEGYVSLGPPVLTPIGCNLVAVHLLSYGPQPRGGRGGGAAAEALVMPFVATWQVEVWEDCYPQPGGEDEPEFVPIELYHEVNRHVTAHATAVYGALWQGWTNPESDFYGDVYPSCDELTFGQMAPLVPQGPCAGFRFTLSGKVPPASFDG